MIPAPRTAARFTGRAAFACFFAIFFTAWSPRKTLTSAWAVGVFATFAKAAASMASASSRVLPAPFSMASMAATGAG